MDDRLCDATSSSHLGTAATAATTAALPTAAAPLAGHGRVVARPCFSAIVHTAPPVDSPARTSGAASRSPGKSLQSQLS